jgi:hypothetical protein
MSFWKYRPGAPESKSLDSVTSGTGRSISVQDYDAVSWLVEAIGTVAGGAVAIECSNDRNYAGTWKLLATVTPVTNSQVGDQFAFPPGAYVRARVTTNITGGATVSVYLNGLQKT